MGVYTCIAVLGMISGKHKTVWIVFSILYIICVGVIGYMVYKGIIIEDESVHTGDQHQNCCNSCNCYPCTCPTKCIHKFWLVLMGVSNVMLAVVGAIIRKPDFATYLLIILLVNLLLYFLLHIILKRCDGGIDLRSWFPRLISKCTIFILAAIILWGLAISYFVIKQYSWELSPEESRKENKPCVLLDFYDYHDVWHFLSAGAIFFSFMVLLTLDGDLDNRPGNTMFIF
ncbi:SID1 transmembrane family member 2-like [Pomacea canaliculata]|uniref:SID1 transmembrane family member 2-like n=1 Tax=Pomacea canaliculata TaxID=400727 RepID=UPI000D7337ED|nr:SID1 transmembrane family member 2-like [Pomacea canaliculata]XP_025102971.1 SID1 transmembrane family member 2-like [Pomacea canaliculata]XP_025102972.1 SID1 transmembrane family member 2-like [Pomacea canaliculata]XP_025102973.1 SID1 transmembrane family member 2-like [Pomacea canaliculata]